MTTLVLTVIGDDRTGLVHRLSEIIAAHGGNWTTSRMAELAGTFAGIVLVDVDSARADELTAALMPLADHLQIAVRRGQGATANDDARVSLDLVGDDRPGIVRQITDVVRSIGGSIETLESEITEAPMTGGRLFEATAVVRLPGDADADALRTRLELLADELMVELTFDA